MNVKINLIILIAVFSMGVSAQSQIDSTKQNQQYAKTLFGGNTKKLINGGYGALSIKYKQIDNSSALLLGGRGGWIANHTFATGLAAYGIISDPKKISNTEFNSYYTGGYGGLYIEAILLSKNLINISIPIEFGGGGIIRIEGKDDDYKKNGNASFLYMEPGLEADLNVSKGFKISLGAY